jgi:hypothetical protein
MWAEGASGGLRERFEEVIEDPRVGFVGEAGRFGWGDTEPPRWEELSKAREGLPEVEETLAP